MNQPAAERLWPEEMICGCFGGECSVCLAMAIAKDVKENTRYYLCGCMSKYCFTCNVEARCKNRLVGDKINPPPVNYRF